MGICSSTLCYIELRRIHLYPIFKQLSLSLYICFFPCCFSGKTACLLSLCRAMRNDQSLSIAAVTNDIFTKEDAEFMVSLREHSTFVVLSHV